MDIIGETCTHYLMLTRDSGLERWAKVNPPIRGQADQDRLWQALTDGTHELVGSDDCGTYTRAEKLGKDFWDAIPGFSDMAATPTLLASEGVRTGRLTWAQMSGSCPLTRRSTTGCTRRRASSGPGQMPI